MNKVLTIVVPTYNMEKYLHKCLDSLIVSDELMEVLEVLVVNDGSKDSSSEIAHEYEKRYPQTFRVIDKENGHYGSCINRGLKEATGKYIKVLDADDYFDTCTFTKYLDYLPKIDSDMVITDFNRVNEAGRKIGKRVFRYQHHSESLVDDFCNDSNFPTMQMHAVTYKTEILRKNNYIQTEGVAYTDQEWVFLPIAYMKTFVKHEGFLYQYLVGREGQSIDPKIASKQADVKYGLIFHRIRQYNKILQETSMSSKRLDFLTQNLFHSICLNYRRGLIDRPYKMDKVKGFDNEIARLNSFLYEESPKSDYGKYHGLSYIETWRRSGHLPFFVNIVRLLAKLKR